MPTWGVRSRARGRQADCSALAFLAFLPFFFFFLNVSSRRRWHAPCPGRGPSAGTSLHCAHPGAGQHLQAQQQKHDRRDEREAGVRRAHQGDRPGQPRPQASQRRRGQGKVRRPARKGCLQRGRGQGPGRAPQASSLGVLSPWATCTPFADMWALPWPVPGGPIPLPLLGAFCWNFVNLSFVGGGGAALFPLPTNLPLAAAGPQVTLCPLPGRRTWDGRCPLRAEPKHSGHFAESRAKGECQNTEWASFLS